MSNKFYAIVEFEDGLQLIPNNWLSGDLTKSFWPNFTNNKRYDKAVKLMEKPECNWFEHPIRKIYGTFYNYAIARKKLKEAEELSDINSGTEREENLKKTRKVRAAKTIDESSEDELSEEMVVSEIPKFPKRSITAETKKILKITNNIQKDFNYSKRHYTKESQTKNKCCTEEEETDDSYNLHCDEADAESFDVNNTIEIKNVTSNPLIYEQDPNCNENLFNTKQLLIKEINGNVPTQLDKNAFNSLINKQGLHCNENFDASTELTEFEKENTNVPISKEKSNLLINKQEFERFQRFVINKLINFELKINSIERSLKLILEKVSIRTFETEEKEIVDIFLDLPLKNEDDLQSMETKLSNDTLYRNEMIKQLARVTCQDLRTSCIRLMKTICTNELAVNYSWYGAKKKENFSKLHICRIIMAAARKLHTNATDEEISAPIKIWLAHAKERLQRQTLN